MNAFQWRNDARPSIFATDKAFTGNRAGKTFSQVSSEMVDTYTKKHGRNPGSIMGISDIADRLVVQGVEARRRKGQ